MPVSQPHRSSQAKKVEVSGTHLAWKGAKPPPKTRAKNPWHLCTNPTSTLYGGGRWQSAAHCGLFPFAMEEGQCEQASVPSQDVCGRTAVVPRRRLDTQAFRCDGVRFHLSTERRYRTPRQEAVSGTPSDLPFSCLVAGIISRQNKPVGPRKARSPARSCSHDLRAPAPRRTGHRRSRRCS